MKLMFLFLSFGLGAALILGGSSDDNSALEIPGPIAMTEEAVGYYCNMDILEHTGPKAQIHLKSIDFPIWFSQVRDAVAFTRLPEETYEVTAIYVHDMSRAVSWEAPGDDAWININKAHFVIESGKIGGMGAPETIPFGTNDAASEFAALNGGKVVKFSDIPDEYVIGPIDVKHQPTGSVQ